VPGRRRSAVSSSPVSFHVTIATIWTEPVRCWRKGCLLACLNHIVPLQIIVMSLALPSIIVGRKVCLVTVFEWIYREDVSINTGILGSRKSLALSGDMSLSPRLTTTRLTGTNPSFEFTPMPVARPGPRTSCRPKPKPSELNCSLRG
jgi:hypothetical protein